MHAAPSAVALLIACGGCSGESDQGGTAGTISTALPDAARSEVSEYVATESGGYQRGELLWTESMPWTEEMISARLPGGGCVVMGGVVRDFLAGIDHNGDPDPDGHPDFETYEGEGPTEGLVAAELGANDKPVYASRCEGLPDPALCPHGPQTTGRAAFNTWFHTVDSAPHLLFLTFAQKAGVSTFESNTYFPVEGAGHSRVVAGHNFGFTTELHTRFLYSGGEHLVFGGDDDLWVFVNRKLAVDLGGVHPHESVALDLDRVADELGIEPGNVYTLDVFDAERRSESSSFRMDTTVEFTECGQITPE